ncbi:MAG: hypothetical protein Q9219_000952 [cf. Caloplaca sp. 3 TL-2023]
MAADYAKYNTDFEVIGGYLSPVSDAYRKAGLASAQHRVSMTRIATEQSSKWLDVDPWEADQKEYQPTALVLDHFEQEINVVQRGIATLDGERKAVKIVLLAGADLIQTMSTPGVWSQEDLDHILGKYGVFIVERTGTDIDDALATLSPWRHNIWVIQQLIQNDVSSTKIRLFLKREMSVRYLVPAPVINRGPNSNDPSISTDGSASDGQRPSDDGPPSTTCAVDKTHKSIITVRLRATETSTMTHVSLSKTT